MKNYLLLIAVLCFVSNVFGENISSGTQSGQLIQRRTPNNRRDVSQNDLNVSADNNDRTDNNIKGFERLALTDKAAPPLDRYTVKDIQALTIPNAFIIFRDIVAKLRAQKKTAAEIAKTYASIISSFIKARSDKTRALDTQFSSIYIAYEQLPRTATGTIDSNILSKFKTFITSQISPTLTAADKKQITDAIAKF